MPNKRIADALGVTEGTVKQHLKDLFRRLERAQPHASRKGGAAPGVAAEIVAPLDRDIRGEKKEKAVNLPSLFCET